MSILHTYNDGSKLVKLSAKQLITIPIWKGNRILDKEHMETLRKSVGTKYRTLDSGYKIIKYFELCSNGQYEEQSYLIDGQHRVSLLRDFFASAICEPDFDVTVTEKRVSSELEAIQYFNEVNTVKAQSWETDPNLITNLYVAGLEDAFNKKKARFIRKGVTHRPYLSSDKVRIALGAMKGLKSDQDDVKAFVKAAVAINDALGAEVQVQLAHRDDKFLQKAVEVGFYLALDPKLKWVARCFGKN